MMEGYGWILFLSMQFTLIIGVISFLKDPHSKQFQILSIYCFLITIWGFTIFRYMHTTGDGTAYYWFKLGFLKFFEPAVLIHLVLYFTKSEKHINKKWKLALLYLPSLLMSIWFLSTESFYVGLEIISNTYTSAGYNLPLASVLSILWFLISHVAAIIIALRYFLKVNVPMKKMQALLVLIAVSLPTLIRIILGATHSMHNILLEIESIAYPISVLLLYIAIARFEYVKLDFKDAIDQIIDSNNQIYILVDSNGLIVKCNNAITVLLNIDPTEIVGNHFNTVLFYGNKTDGLESFIQNVNKEGTYSADVYIRSKEKEKIPVQMFLKEMKEVGLVKGYAIRFLDKSELHRVNSEVDQYELKLKREREIRYLSTLIYQEIRESSKESINASLELVLSKIRTNLELADAFIVLEGKVYSDPDVSVTSLVGGENYNYDDLTNKLDELGISYFELDISSDPKSTFIGIPRDREIDISSENKEYLKSILFSVRVALEYIFYTPEKDS
jgi:PAS domain S-box-containing protein